MFKDFIWDLGGTLFDSYPAKVASFKKALEEQKIFRPEEEIMQYVKISTKFAENHYVENYHIDVEKFASDVKNLEKTIFFDKIIPYESVIEVCKKIHDKGDRNFIITHRGDSTFVLLKKFNMERYFAEVVTKEHLFKRKPDPEAYLYLINKYKMEKSYTIGIGDREIDYHAAKNAGINFCFFNPGCHNLDFQPTIEIKNFIELLNII